MSMLNLQRRGSPSSAAWWLSLLAAAGLVQGQQLPPASPTSTTPPATVAPPTAPPSTVAPTPPPSPTDHPSPSPTSSLAPTSISATPTVISTTVAPTAASTTTLGPSTTVTVATISATITSTIAPVPSSKSSSSSNLPVIVGSAAGAAALLIIIATTIICLRRRRRNNRELTFDTLQGMSTAGSARPSQRYNATTLPAAGRPSVAPSGYDDGFDYDSPASRSPAQGYAGHAGYEVDNGYDAYGVPSQAYQNPSIFQEDNLAYGGAMGRGRGGYNQNLPEITYRNGNDINHPSGEATGYYDDSMYSQQVGWNPNMSGGYIGPTGLWVANPTAERPYPQEYLPDYHPEQEGDIVMHQSPVSYERNAINQYDNSSDTVVGSASPRSKFRGHNPQTLPESPRLHQLRGGDLFGQDSEAAPTSPRTAAAQVVPADSAATLPVSSSPRLAARGEMRSFEMARHSPTTRSSGDGVQSYANEYVAGRGSTSDRPSLDNGSNLNPGKSLRTLRRDDWS